MRAMILAAGQGTRLRPLTKETPKPLLQTGRGTRLIEALLRRLSRSGFYHITINICYRAAQFPLFLGDGARYGVRITYAVETEAQCWDTGGGIRHALPLLGAMPFLVVSGDIYTDYPFHHLRAVCPPPQGGHVVCVPLQPTSPQPDFFYDPHTHRLNNIARQACQIGQKPVVYGNIGVYDPGIFRLGAASRFSLGTRLREAVARERVYAEYYHQGTWLNVGTPKQWHAFSTHVDA